MLFRVVDGPQAGGMWMRRKERGSARSDSPSRDGYYEAFSAYIRFVLGFLLHSEDLLTYFRKPSSGSWVWPSVSTLEGDLFDLRRPEITKSMFCLGPARWNSSRSWGCTASKRIQEAQNLINTSTNLGVCFHFRRYGAGRPDTSSSRLYLTSKRSLVTNF